MCYNIVKIFSNDTFYYVLQHKLQSEMFCCNNISKFIEIQLYNIYLVTSQKLKSLKLIWNLVKTDIPIFTFINIYKETTFIMFVRIIISKSIFLQYFSFYFENPCHVKSSILISKSSCAMAVTKSCTWSLIMKYSTAIY